MAKYRTVKMSFWNDPYVEDLNPKEKLFYLYLFTGPHTNNLGILEISKKKMSFESGLSPDEIDEILSVFERDGKVVLEGNVIWLVKFIKNQTTTSQKMIQGLFKLIPEISSPAICKQVCETYPHIFKKMDTPSNPNNTVSIPLENVSKEKSKGNTSSIPLENSDFNQKGNGMDRVPIPLEVLEREREKEREGEKEILSLNSSLNLENKIDHKNSRSGESEFEELFERSENPDPNARGSGPKKTDCPSKSNPSRQGFMACWEVYPVKQGEEDAWREWCRLESNGTLESSFAIHDRIVLMAQEDDRWKDGFTPKFAKWLNGKGWNDEPYKKPENGSGITNTADFLAQAKALREQNQRGENDRQ